MTPAAEPAVFSADEVLVLFEAFIERIEKLEALTEAQQGQIALLVEDNETLNGKFKHTHDLGTTNRMIADLIESQPADPFGAPR